MVECRYVRVSCFESLTHILCLSVAMTALIGCATESGGPPQDDATVFMVDPVRI